MAQTLFPSRPQGATNALCHFHCGVMNASPIEGDKFKVSADKRKGLITLERAQDGMLHLYWKTRPNINTLEDYMILPGQQTFEKVDTGKDADRVYLLQFKGQSKRRFFWMQEPNEKKDKDTVKQLREKMNSPPTPGAASPGGAAAGAGGAGGARGDLSSFMANIAAQRAGSAAQGATPTAPQTQAAPAASSAGISADAFMAALMGAAAAVQQQQQPRASLGAVLRGSNLDEFLAEGGHEDLEQLLPEQTTEELRQTARTPQFSQAVGRLNNALQTSNYNALLSNFGLNPAAGASEMQRGDGTGAFLQAIQTEADNASAAAAATATAGAADAEEGSKSAADDQTDDTTES